MSGTIEWGDYLDLCEHLVRRVAEKGAARKEPLCCIWLVVGHRYQGELLVIGRAPNGSDSADPKMREDGWLPAEALSATRRQQIVASYQKFWNERDPATHSCPDCSKRCPMMWVVTHEGSRYGYNTRTSPFWRVTKQVTQGLGLDNTCPSVWSSAIAWSNIFKVSPAERGSPPGWLKSAQLPSEAASPSAADLLRLEIKLLKPKRVLVLAGAPWYRKILANLGMNVPPEREGPVDGAVDFKGARWILAKHPQGKPERRMVERILNAFRR